MNKFKVGDLITDQISLYQVVSVDEDNYQVKIIVAVSRQGRLKFAKKERAESMCVKYDLSKPLTKIVNNGVCHCSYCYKELYYGDDCVRDNGDVYCDEECLIEDLTKYSEDSVINENDLDARYTIEKPLFELAEEQLKLIEHDHEQRNNNS